MEKKRKRKRKEKRGSRGSQTGGSEKAKRRRKKGQWLSIGGLNNGRSCVECRTQQGGGRRGEERRREDEGGGRKAGVERNGVERKIEVRAGEEKVEAAASSVLVTWHRRGGVQRGCCEKGWVARQRTSTLKPPQLPPRPPPPRRVFARSADEDSVDTRAPVFVLRSGIPQFPFSRVPALSRLSLSLSRALSLRRSSVGHLKRLPKRPLSAALLDVSRSWLFPDRREICP